MGRIPTMTEVYQALAAMQSDPEGAYDPFEDRLRRESNALHVRRMRSDATRSIHAKHSSIQRHQARRAKQAL